MLLKDIIKDCGVIRIEGNPDREIREITCDSRKVGPGSLFIAVKGFSVDGHDFIPAAVRAGAAAIIYQDPGYAFPEGENTGSEAQSGFPGGEGTVFVLVESSRRAEAVAACNFYGNPSRRLTLVGITGTNGKTTTVTLLYNLFTRLGYCCGLLSTVANYVGSKRYDTANTTADPLTINRLLDEMTQAGCEYCFMEVSSIGVEQERIAGLDFKAGIFSNLTHDHLDYHKTFAEYLRCKKLFFDRLGPEAFAITNIDDRNGKVMLQNTRARKVTYSLRSMADHNARIMEESFEGMLLRIDGKETWTRLIGQHNAYNILAVYTTAVTLGAETEETLTAISDLKSAPGRLENLNGPDGKSVVIDYAHTPDALGNVLKTLREIAPDRPLYCVFGCGGDRDRTKRPEMGKIAGEAADVVVVTSDNSRTEKTSDIIADIKAGMDLKARAKSLFIEDREQAIRTAVMTSPEGSTILLAGKGHEDYQIIGKEKRHFDEKEIVKAIFMEMNELKR